MGCVRDRDNVTRSVRILGTEIEDSGIGRYRQWVDFEGRGRPVATGYHHPMGGDGIIPIPPWGSSMRLAACMGSRICMLSEARPSRMGMVTNPTLTILALSVRLATDLKSTLR